LLNLYHAPPILLCGWRCRGAPSPAWRGVVLACMQRSRCARTWFILPSFFCYCLFPTLPSSFLFCLFFFFVDRLYLGVGRGTEEGLLYAPCGTWLFYSILPSACRGHGRRLRCCLPAQTHAHRDRAGAPISPRVRAAVSFSPFLKSPCSFSSFYCGRRACTSHPSRHGARQHCSRAAVRIWFFVVDVLTCACPAPISQWDPTFRFCDDVRGWWFGFPWPSEPAFGAGTALPGCLPITTLLPFFLPCPPLY